jgi:hypothetical protein
MFVAGLGANFEYDLKKIIALSALRQLGLMIITISVGLSGLAFFHLLTHGLFMKEEALDRFTWRTRFEGSFGPVAKETAKLMNELGRWANHLMLCVQTVTVRSRVI